VLRGITGYRWECRVRTTVLDQTCVKHPNLLIRVGTGPKVTCRSQNFKWLTRYNTVRRHLQRGYLPPTNYEKQT